MQLKTIFLVINVISAILLTIIAFRIKPIKKYSNSIRGMIFSAAFAVLANALIALADSKSFAYVAYCLYFSELDWICYFLCRFSITYTDHFKLLKIGKYIAVALCLVDNVMLYSNIATHKIYEIYALYGKEGTWYYLYTPIKPYYIHLALDYILVLLALITLTISFFKSYAFYRIKYLSIIVIVWTIIILNVIYMTFSLLLDFSVLFYVLAGILLYYYADLYVPVHIKNRAFGLVFDYMNEGLILFDKDQNCIFINKMAREELDFKHENLVFPSSMMNEIIKERDLNNTEAFTEMYETSEEDKRIYKVYFHNMFDKKHRTLGSFFIFENVTIEYTAYQRMAEAQAEAKSANQAKSMFLANMSHEIRTPINSVLGMNEMILRDSSDSQILDYSKNIEAAGNTLLTLINDILDFSKIEAGKLELVEAPYSFQQLIHECYIMLLPKAESKDISFNVKLDENIPCKLYGDKHRILQVLINIASNALKYTEKGSVTINVTYEKLNESDIALSIRVIDTGIGISEENRKKLFGTFVRVDQLKNSNIEGTGLGLAITKQLTAMMNGNITVESEEGKGSVFTIRIIQKVEDPNPGGAFRAQEEKEHKPVKADSFKAPDAKILIVDDIKTNLKVATALLRRTEIQIDTASSGTEAIELCEKKKYDLILMDHMMPDPDGIATFKAIRGGDGPNKDTPEIILTANAINGASDEYLEIGFDDYLSKPVKPADLESVLLKHLSSEMIK